MKEVDGNIVLSRVLCGGAADRSGMLHPGDVLHEINGRELTGFSVDDVADLMVTNLATKLSTLCLNMLAIEYITMYRKISLALLCSR